MSNNLEYLRQRLPLPGLMGALGLGEQAERLAFCPFHKNTKTGAFSVWVDNEDRYRWKCHAGCGGGDEVDFLEKYLGLSKKDAIHRYIELAGGAVYWIPTRRTVPRLNALERKARVVRLPDDIHVGTWDELQTVARLRGVDAWAVATMQQNGILRFGTVCGQRCWLAMDNLHRNVESRRLDGRKFAAFDSLGERKVHTLAGSSKAWPVGLAMPGDLLKYFGRILLVEGSGDLVAGYHFALLGAVRRLPIAMLGAGVDIAPEALHLLAGRDVVIVPHIDPGCAGEAAGRRWAAQLQGVGCLVRALPLHGVEKINGESVKDLNDCVCLPAEARSKIVEALS